MRTKKPSRVLCLLLSAVMLLALLPAMSVTAEAANITEQFNLNTGKTYYFDLSGEVGNIGIVNTAVPDKTLHYVPFTYAGTVNAYSLASAMATTDEYANANKSDRSLFVADYNVSYRISWNALNKANLIFGKPFDTNYKLRSLSVGSDGVDQAGSRGSPTTNEWDSILGKNGLTAPIKNWENIFSWGQDTFQSGSSNRAMRGGFLSAASWSYDSAASSYLDFGFRPALEVLNPASLGNGGLKAVTLNLNGGSFDSKTDSLNIVCAGSTFKAPSAAALTRPAGNTDTYFKWNTKATGDGTGYDVGANVPNTVTTLYAQWETAATNPQSSAVDVQGKVIEGAFGVYKLDVSWGAMKFDYNAAGAVWNPDTHSYEAGGGTKGWTNESFVAPNNQITVENHSNGDVMLSYLAKPDAVLTGTTMTVRSTNSLAGDLAANLLLAKVPTENNMTAPTVDTFVWLTGEPTNLANSKSYTKAGVITITATPDMTSGLTPKTTP